MPTTTLTLKRVIELEGENNIGLSNYPLFDDTYRDTLNRKIIRHYYLREIGHETISIFKYQLETKMNEIMPLWNQHYVLSLLEVDPLSTISMHSLTNMDSTGTSKGTSASDSDSAGKSRAVASETPQTQLSPNQDYASAIQDNVSDTTATTKATEDSTNTQAGKNDNTVTGYQGHAPGLVLAARQALVNVDMMVIDDLKELFMLVWQNDDEFTNRPYPYGMSRYNGFY
jgi:hypothetical protein